MRPRIGIAIAHDAFRVVVVRGREIVWARETERDPGEPSAESLAALFSDAPLRRWPRPHAAAVVGPHASQVKLLAGLPPLDDTGMLSAMVRENKSAFFIGAAAGLCTTGVRPVEAGIAWCAAIDATHIECIRRACRSLRVDLVSIAPCAVVLQFAVRSTRFTRTDGPITLEIELSEGNLALVRRILALQRDQREPVEFVDELSALGERAERFADAYGAAIAPTGIALTLGPAGDVPWDRRRQLRAVLPSAITAAAAAAALLLSPLIPAHAVRRAESRVRAIHTSEEWRLTTDVRSQLRRATAVLTEIEHFASSRSERTALLARLANALPAGAALESLEVTNNDVRLVAVASEASSAIAAIRAVPEFSSVRVVGEIVRATVNSAGLERFSVALENQHPLLTDSAQ